MQKILFSIILLAGSILTTITYAATINIYEKSDPNSKIVTSVKTGDQLIPIFYTEKKDWIKVANPKNGEVGWVKADQLKGPTIVTQINGTTVQQQIINGKEKKPIMYGIIQYGGSTEDAEKFAKAAGEQYKKMKSAMEKMQIEMQKTFQEMSQNVDKVLSNLPIFQPVVVVPKNQQEKRDKK